MNNYCTPDLSNRNGKPLFAGPQGVTILTTYACNSRCINCNLWNSKQPYTTNNTLTIKEYEKIFSDEMFSKVKGYGISGGEPSLSPVTSELLRIIPSQISFLMATNSVNPDRIFPLMKQMAERGNCYLMVSIDGIGEISDKVRGIDGHFRNAIKILEFSKSISLPAVVSSTLNIVNCHQLRQLYALTEIYNTGFHFRAVTEGTGYYNTSEEQKILGQFSGKQIQQLEDDIDWVINKMSVSKRKTAPQIYAHFSKIPDYLRGKFKLDYCLAGDSMFMLDPTGEVLPCPSYYKSMGNLHDYNFSLKELWNSEKATQVRQMVHTTKCGSCWNDCQWPSNLGPFPDLVTQILQEYNEKIAKKSGVPIKLVPQVDIIKDSSRYAHMGKGVQIGQDADIRNPERIWIDDKVFVGNNVWLNITFDQILSSDGKIRIKIGKRTVIGRDTFISASDSVSIGDNCLIAPNVHICDTGHNFMDVSVPMIDQGVIQGRPVKIGNNCWIGINAVVLPGVTVGDGSIIGANAVVTKDIPSYSIVGGNPARILKLYDPLEREFKRINSQDDYDLIMLHRERTAELVPSHAKIEVIKKDLNEYQNKSSDVSIKSDQCILDMVSKTTTNVRLTKHFSDKMKNNSVKVKCNDQILSLPLSNYAGPNFPTLFDDKMVEILEIADSDNVLDIGGGANPFARANVVIDAFYDNSVHRAWNKIPNDKRYNIAKCELLPFKDKSFDFVYSRHALEHVDDPRTCMKEIMRVGKRGFFEVPNRLYDLLLGGPTHSWAIDLIDGVIMYRRRPFIESPLKYVLYKQWQEDIDFRMRFEVYFRNLFFIQFYWEDSFKCVVDDKNENGRYDLNDKECAIRSHFDFGKEMYLQGSSMHRAEPELKHVLELAPGHTAAGQMLANIYMQQGNINEARQCLQKVSEVNTQNVEVANILERMKNIGNPSKQPANPVKTSAEKWAAMSRNTIPYDRYLRFPYIAKYLDAVVKYWKNGPTLETGIGSGYCSIFMSKNGAKAEGFDNSHDVVISAQEFNKRYEGSASFFLGDLFKEESYCHSKYDVIFHQGVLEHFSDDDIRKIIGLQVQHAEHVVFSVPSQYFPRKVFGDERLLSKEKWEEILNGFHTDELYYYGDPAYRCDEKEHLLIVVSEKKQ